MDYNQLYQQYSGFTDPFGRRREEEEDAVGNARPVTQTIRTDPVTGEQTMTIKGSPQDLSAANPLTPTVSMPGSTAGGFLGGYQDMAPAPQMQPQMAAPQMQPQQAAADNRNIVPLEQPQPGQAGGFLGEYQDMAPAPQMQPQQAAPVAPAPQMAAPQMQPQQAAPEMQPPVAPVAPQAPPMVSAPPAQPSIQAVAPGAAPAPQQAAPEGDYTQRMLAGLRQREGNYNTPPHSASSAQGAYGITAPAYSDIQRADPYFANRAQGQLTPEDQDRAALVLRGLNQQRLRSQGVEPSEANQQLAHFLGPKGAADYLASGYISPEAAAANGGVEKVREIAEERLAFGRSLSGQAGPAVAAVGREMGMNEPGYGGAGTMPAQSAITAASTVINDAFEKNDVNTLYKMAGSDNPQISGPARDKLEIMRNKQRGQKDADQMITDNKTTDLSRHLTSRNKDGSWIKYYLLKRLGMDEMAKEEAELLGSGTKMAALTSTDGKQYSADVDGNGAIVKAWDESGKAVTNANILANLQSSSLPKGGIGQATGTRVRDNKGVEWSQVPTTRGMVFYNNKGERGVPSGKTVPIGIGSDIQLQGELATQKKQIDLSWDPIIAAAKTGAEGLTNYNIKYGTNFAIAGTGQNGQPLIVDNNTGQIARPNNRGVVSATTGAAPGTSGPNIQAAEISGANLTAMNKDIQDNMVPEARKADQQVNSINEMFNILKEPGNERVFGIYNGVMEGKNARDKKLFSDFIAGKVVAGSPEYDDFRRRYSELGLTEDQVGVLRRMDALSAAGVGASVRELTGNVGISNQDVKIAQRNNVSVGEWPMLAAYSQLNYQRFEADLKRSKAEWAADNMNQFPNSAAMDKAWRTESAKIRKDNENISEARAKYLRGYQSLGPTQKAAKIKEAYELYPPPRYQEGEWRNRKTGSLSSMTIRE